MNTLTLVSVYLQHNWQRTAYNVILFALGTALMAGVMAVGNQFNNNLTRNLRGIDMVVGAKGSPLQLVLSSVLHADVPTGNIPLKEAEKLKDNPLIAATVPLALGDNLAGYRIVGTTPDYITWYGGKLEPGSRIFGKTMEAVAGHSVATALGLKVGGKFAGSHGLAPGGEVHSFAPYTLVGILKPTGTILDRLVLTPVESVWYVHENDDDEPVESRPKPENREVTAVLVKYRTPLAVASLPRFINKQTNMQAASPVWEAMRLRKLMGIGSDTLKLLGATFIGIAALGLLVAMAEAMRQRLYDLALMRCFGATPPRVIVLVLIEGVLISAVGAALGLALSYGLARFAALQMFGGQLSEGGMQAALPQLVLFAAVVGLGIVGSLLPALRIYRISIPRLLANR